MNTETRTEAQIAADYAAMVTDGPRVAESSTGMLHLIGRVGQTTNRRPTYSAACATDYRVGTRAVYLRNAHNLTEAERATAKLCRKCFPPAAEQAPKVVAVEAPNAIARDDVQAGDLVVYGALGYRHEGIARDVDGGGEPLEAGHLQVNNGGAWYADFIAAYRPVAVELPATPEGFAELPAHAYLTDEDAAKVDASWAAVCLFCLENRETETYEVYAAKWYAFEYEGELNHEPIERESWEYSRATCLIERRPVAGEPISLEPAEVVVEEVAAPEFVIRNLTRLEVEAADLIRRTIRDRGRGTLSCDCGAWETYIDADAVDTFADMRKVHDMIEHARHDHAASRSIIFVAPVVVLELTR